MTTASTPPSLALRVLLVTIAVAAILVPAIIVLKAPPIVPTRHHRLAPVRVVPKAELPPRRTGRVRGHVTRRCPRL